MLNIFNSLIKILVHIEMFDQIIKMTQLVGSDEWILKTHCPGLVCGSWKQLELVE